MAEAGLKDYLEVVVFTLLFLATLYYYASGLPVVATILLFTTIIGGWYVDLR